MKTPFPGQTTGERFRQVAGSVLVALHLLNAATVYVVLNDGQSAPSDRDGLGAAELACLLSICLSIGAIQLCLRPSVRRALGLWWTAPAVVLGAIASVRLAALF
ncbi:hypothetical protein ACFXPI_16455 [Streptomyces sp. NPDC059104]|uniref:hypothetical protein n=1 Tax=Streptomyces sp. NPDC059104 TaxID=3346729 RepID=UPI00369B809B